MCDTYSEHFLLYIVSAVLRQIGLMANQLFCNIDYDIRLRVNVLFRVFVDVSAVDAKNVQIKIKNVKNVKT